MSGTDDSDVTEKLGSRCLCLLLVLLFYPTPKTRIEAVLQAQQRYMTQRGRGLAPPTSERVLRTHALQLMNVFQQEWHCISHAYGKLDTCALDGQLNMVTCSETNVTRRIIEVCKWCSSKQSRILRVCSVVDDKDWPLDFCMRAGKSLFNRIRIVV